MPRTTDLGSRVVVCALLIFLAVPEAVPLRAQSTPSQRSSDSYILANARVVVSPDEVLDGASVVIRDGRIEAVGATVEYPSGAEVLDLNGMVVYPGLIDVAATPRAGRSSDGLDPSRRAIDGADLTESTRDGWRSIGVTTLGLAHSGGTDQRREPGPQYRIVQENEPLLPGLTAVVSSGAGPLEGQVVLDGNAVQVGFGTRTIHAYPVTLMGSIAFVHQAFLDAAYQYRLRQTQGTSSVFRPEIEPLERAATGDQQVWFTVWQEGNIRRAIELAEELELDYFLLGAQEGFRVPHRLAETGRPVLVSVFVPPASQATGRSVSLDAFGASGGFREPEEIDATAEQAFRSNPSVLVNSGVPVALTSYGLDDAREFRAALLEVVNSGLSPTEALRALTVTPATILGLEDRLGTVESGKIANLLIVEGDLFTPDAVIRAVFVEGERYDVHFTAERNGVIP